MVTLSLSLGESHAVDKQVGNYVSSVQQDITISGHITNELNDPIGNATVRIEPQNMVTETDKSGYYTLKVSKAVGSTITVNCLGHVAQQKKITQSTARITLDWQLKTDQKILTQIEVVGKTNAVKLKERGFNVNVVNASKFYNSSLDLNQILNQTTGVRVREEGGLGSDFKFSLNGMSGRSVKFFVDGLPMDNFGASLGLNNLPASMVDQIEVYKGVVPMTLGTDALGGAVNIITRKDANYLDVSYGYGSFNTHKASLNGAYTDEKTGLSYRFNGFYNYSDNDYKVEVSPIKDNKRLPLQKVKRFHDNYSSLGGHAEIGITGKKYADQLFIGLLASKNDKDIQTGVTMDQVFGARKNLSSSIIPTLKYKKSDLLIDGLDLNIYSAYNITTGRVVDTSGLIYNWLQETTYDPGKNVLTQLKNRDKEGLVTSGLSYSINQKQKISLNYVLTDFRRRSSDIEDPSNVTHKLPKSLRKQNLGIGWDGNWDQLQLNLFGKYYRLNARSFENKSQNNIPDYQTTTTERSNWGYGAAGSYFLIPELLIKASYEHAYRLPDPEEMLGDGLFTARNPNLRPEKSDNINLGAIYKLALYTDHHFQIESNLIYRKSEDYIRLEQARNQPTDRKFINVGNVDTKGIEGEIKYGWKNFLHTSVNVSYQNIIDKTEFIYSSNLSGNATTPNLNYGYKIPNTPYLFGNFDLGVNLKHNKRHPQLLSLNYSLNYVEKYYLTPQQIGLNNEDIIPKQIAHNIMANCIFKEGRYNIALECRNFTDNKLFDNYKLQKPGRSVFVKLRYFIKK